jgi:HEAT repeat protein
MSKSSFVRAQAAERIGLASDPRAIPRLEKCLTDRSPEVRMRAVEALGKLTSGRHQALATALKDTDELVRLQAAESIGARADGRTVSALRVAVRDDSALVRSYAAAALGRAGTRADRALLRTRVRRESSDAARLGFLEGLWLLGDRAVLGSAIQLLNSHDYRVRCATARALGGTFSNSQTQGPIITALRGRLRRERTSAVREALVDSLSTVDTKN